MNDEVNKYIEAINSYLKSKSDYAILLDGEWGSGKTFFVNNVLKDELRNTKIIHTSLYGKTSIGDVNAEALGSVFWGNKKCKKYVSLIAKIVKECKPEITNVVSATLATACDSLEDTEKLNNELQTKYLFVFDDIERCDSSILPNLLGEIHSQYTERGYHVLYVANEKQIINNDWYKENKEKLIRHTMNFSYPDLSALLHSIINSREENSSILMLYNNAPNAFDEFVKVVEKIKNIRTWLTSFDYYDAIYKNCKFDFEPHFCLQLFCITLLTAYFCRESDRDEKYGDSTDIEAIAADKFKIQPLRRFNDFSKDFFYRFMKTEQLRFIKLDSFVSYIKTGCCVAEKIKKEYESYFHNPSKAEKCRLKLSDYCALSQDELKECLDGVYDGLFNKAYSLESIAQLSIIFEIIDARGYLALFEDAYSGYKDVFINAVENISKEQIGDYFDGDFLPDTKYDYYSGNILKETLDKAYSTYRENEAEEYKKNFEIFFKSLDEHQVSDLFPDEGNGIIEDADKFNLFPLILSFSSKAISILDTYIRVLPEPKNGMLYRQEAKHIKKLGEFLEEKNPTLEQNKRLCDLIELKKSIDTVLNSKSKENEGALS